MHYKGTTQAILLELGKGYTGPLFHIITCESTIELYTIMSCVFSPGIQRSTILGNMLL